MGTAGSIDDRRRGPSPWLLPVLALACVLRLADLGAEELRGDEAFGFFFLQPSYGQIVSDTIALAEPHPVASYFLQKAWLALAGTSEFALRFSSAWFSILAVALLYRLARRLRLPAGLAVLAAALLALSPYALWHSQDARMYSMLLALTIASSWLALEALARRRFRYWAAYVVVTWLALHTHYSAAFVVLAQDIFVLGWACAGRRWRVLAHWLAGQVILALLYAPWLWAVGRNLSAYTGNGDSPGWPAMLYRSFSALAFGETVPAGLRAAVGLLAGGLALWGFIKLAWGPLKDPSAYAGWWLALYLLVPLGATWLSAATRPIFNERYLVAAVPPFYLLLAAGLAAPWSDRVAGTEPGKLRRASRTWPAAAALALLLAGMAVSLFGYYANPAFSKTHGWRDLAASIRRQSAGLPAAQVRVSENFPDPTLWYYYTDSAEHVILPPAPLDAPGAQAEVDRLAQAGVNRVLLPLMPANNWDPTGLASAALARRFVLVGRQQAGAWPMEVYARPNPDALQPVGTTFEGGATLARAGVEPMTLVPGGLLVVYLDWQGTAGGTQNGQKLFVHVTDAQGAPVAQADPPFGADQLGKVSAYGISLPAHLPPGRYRVLAGMYDPGRPGAPRLVTAQGADHVTLAEIMAGGE